MADEQKKEPTFKPSELEPMKPVRLTLKSAKPVATGSNKHGVWNLWTIRVENATVFEREGNKKVVGYTGDAVCFPSDKLHEQFLQHTNGTKENVTIEVALVPKKGNKGFYTTFETVLVEGGTTPPSNLSNTQLNFINDFTKFVDNGIFKNDQGLQEHFINMAQSSTYQLSKEVAEKLWTVYLEKRQTQ